MATLLDHRDLTLALAGDAADFVSRFISRPKLAERWHTRPKTLRLLERRKVIPEAFALPGRREKVYRIADIARIEAEYAGGPVAAPQGEVQ